MELIQDIDQKWNFSTGHLGNFYAGLDKINSLVQSGTNFCMILVCGKEELVDSEIVVLDKEQLKELFLNRNKGSVTVSRKKREKCFRVSIGGGRGNSVQVKVNRFEDIFK